MTEMKSLNMRIMTPLLAMTRRIIKRRAPENVAFGIYPSSDRFAATFSHKGRREALREGKC
ncbi:hypothetical protein C5748_19290 [Phyllobacterium phragmitis]|uniref:Uncharacterized protein n=1 Tax=Phyllobacterium phragmitis TaxID=2670329 RepID=A0A2S9IMR3_9HYPH|nr:hypothetical protein C5748_19290 [Phyllobacterium phragmitis]